MTSDSKPQAGGFLNLLVLTAFFVSGIAGLVHEVVWIRLLRHVMGNSSFAISVVLTVFMGGLALGSFLAGRLAGRLRRPLVAFAILELGIGLYGLLLPSLLEAAQPLYASLYAAADGSLAVVTAARFGLSALLLFVPATLMGTTLPILAHLFEGATARQGDGERSRMGFGLGTLYAINTLGAAAGAASTGFLWIPKLGMQRTIFLAALLNALVFGAGLLLARSFGSREPAPRVQRYGGDEQAGRGPWRWLLVAYAASGFSALVYEVSWTRVLSAQIGSTVYAFSMMLTAFILGLGLGSLLLAPLVDRLKRPALCLAWVQACIALACLAVVPLFGWLPVRLTGWIASASQGSFLGLQGTLFGVLLLVMLVPTLLMGACFPLVARIATLGGLGAARSVGTIYSANTVGTILGSAVAGFLLIPSIGTQNTIAVGVAVNGLVAALLFGLSQQLDPRSEAEAQSEGGPRVQVLVGAAGALVVGGAVFAMPAWNPSAMSFGPFMEARRNQTGSMDTAMLQSAIDDETERGGILYHEEGLNTTVTVRKDPLGEISLWVNGKPDASSSVDVPTQALLAHVPLLLHPEPRKAMLIGLASGITLGSMAAHPLERMDCAEISQAVVRASDFFRPFNGDVLDDERVRILVEDGRNHLALTEERYDVIVSEPSNPWIAGVADLFTEEFFRICSERLTDEGVVCIWLASYNLDEVSFRSVVRTFMDVFPGGQIWNPMGSDYLLVGGKGELTLDVEALQQRLASPAIAADLARMGVDSAPGFLAHFLCGPDQARGLGAEAPVHTDDNALLEFAAPRNMTRYEDEQALFNAIESFREPQLSFLTGNGAAAVASASAKAVRATGLALRGLQQLAGGQGALAMQSAQEARELHPQNPGLGRLLSSASERAMQGMQSGQADSVLPLLSGLVAADPRRAPEALMLGNLHFQRSAMRKAAEAYSRCLAAAPDQPEANYRLAYILATAPGEALFDPERALSLAQRSVELSQGRLPGALLSLAAARAANGSYPEAVAAIDQALQQLGGQASPMTKQLQAMRQAFAAGQSWRGKR